MRVLWIVNKIFPVPAERLGYNVSVLGGWLNSLLEGIIENNDVSAIAIACTYNGNKLEKVVDDKVIYYMIPCSNPLKYGKKMGYYWQEIVNEFRPDVTHIHGTEYPHALSFMNSCPREKTVTSIQGMVSVYGMKNNYNAGISDIDLLKNITFRDIIRHDLLINQYKKFLKRGEYEKEILRKTNYIIGRTSWDYANTYNITKKDKYIKCNESLRSTFYDSKWNINNVRRNSIFISQATYPIKGFHNMIEALKILKRDYSNVLVYVAGDNIIDCSSFDKKIRRTGYAKYISKLIDKNNLAKNIVFTGPLNETEMVKAMLNSHVYVQASSIENSPNSLGEAMLLSMPCVASYVGGTGDMLEDKKEGFLYPFHDPAMLANYVKKIFEDDSLAKTIGTIANKHAIVTHDRDKNIKDIINVYKKVIGN